MLETSDAQLGVQAGGWECSFGDAVWVVMGEGESGIRRGRREADMTFGIKEWYWGHCSSGEWMWAVCPLTTPPKAVMDAEVLAFISLNTILTFVSTLEKGCDEPLLQAF